MAFQEIVQEILRVEGGYVDRKEDRGGPTNFGITMPKLSEFRKKPVSKKDIQNLTKSEAIAVYKSDFESLFLHQLKDENVQAVLFDQAVNRGKAGMTRTVQFILGLKIDGVMGSKTIAAINNQKPKDFIYNFICASQDKYVDICQHDPGQLANLQGWINRTQKLMKYL